LNNVPTGNVSITGTATQNQILTATNNLVDVDGLGTFNYQWQESVDNGVNWTNISGATNNTITLAQAQVGKTIQAKVSYTDLLGTSETVNSTPTATVTNINDLPTGNVSITGTATQNQILTATNTLADVDGLGTFNYQWQESADNGVNWRDIPLATKNTFTLGEAQGSKQVRVKVGYTDGQGTSETVNSDPTNPIPGSFTEDTSVSLYGVYNGSVAWADYNGDGKPDFLLTGENSELDPITKLYKNTGNGFTEDPSVSLPGVKYSSVAWADYNGDGKQDFLLTGSGKSKLYKNTGNGFTEDTSVSLPGVEDGSVAWADYNGDGKQDFLLTGSYISKLYKNTGQTRFPLDRFRACTVSHHEILRKHRQWFY